MNQANAFLMAGLLALATTEPALAEGRWRLSSGVDFSNGKYGAATATQIVSAPLRAAWTTDDIEISAAVSFVSVSGTGDVIPGDAGPIITLRCARLRERRPDLFERFCRDRLAPPAEPEKVTSAGLGDVVVGFAWTLPEAVSGDWLIDLGARAKLPTASKAQGLGTGKTDVTLSLDIAHGFGALTPFAGLGYRFFGDPSFDGAGGAAVTIDLENGLSGAAGFAYALSPDTSVTLAYDYFARTVASSSAAQEVTLAFSGPISGNWRWAAYGVAGLTRASPDVAVGLTLSYGFSLN
ncbi:MAG: hypothetical protein ACOY99_05335 [Pseudomonadota bacterium]